MTIADYTLEYINGIPYLMPYGQSVADLKKCVKLNDTGIFIWNSLSDGFGRDKILSEMCKKYNAVTPDDKTKGIFGKSSGAISSETANLLWV